MVYNLVYLAQFHLVEMQKWTSHAYGKIQKWIIFLHSIALNPISSFFLSTWRGCFQATRAAEWLLPIQLTNRRRRQRTRAEISLCINAFCSSNILVLMRSDASLRSWSLVLYQQQEHYYTHKTSNKVRKSCLLCCVSDNFRNSINKAAHPVSTSSYTIVDEILSLFKCRKALENKN